MKMAEEVRFWPGVEPHTTPSLFGAIEIFWEVRQSLMLCVPRLWVRTQQWHGMSTFVR